MRVLLVCPIPLEFTSCRSMLSLRDGPRILGCRSATGLAKSAELLAVESGPAKARAASATVAAVDQFRPDLVLDTGTCGALNGELDVADIVLGHSCIEYDISGNGLPDRIIPEMRLPSALGLLPKREGRRLAEALIELGQRSGARVSSGVQACGEFFIQSARTRESLHALSGAAACNWETAAVFVAALRAGVPPLSLRVITDHGDEHSLHDFKRNARRGAQQLYGFIRTAFESKWFSGFQDIWLTRGKAQGHRMSQVVLP